MAEYVDKQKARDLFQQKCYNVSDRINSVEVGMFVEGIMQVLDEATAAGVQPVRRGKWDFQGYQLFKCTNCAKIYTQEQLEDIGENWTFPNFCPNCGADLREGL